MDLKLIGLNIKTYRKRNNMTQAQLAEKADLSIVHISHLENGSAKMSVDTLIVLCNILNATPNDLLWGQYKAVNQDNEPNIINQMLGENASKMTPEKRKLMLEISELFMQK